MENAFDATQFNNAVSIISLAFANSATKGLFVFESILIYKNDKTALDNLIMTLKSKLKSEQDVNHSILERLIKNLEFVRNNILNIEAYNIVKNVKEELMNEISDKLLCFENIL